jgi:hypothetical protein
MPGDPIFFAGWVGSRFKVTVRGLKKHKITLTPALSTRQREEKGIMGFSFPYNLKKRAF